MMTSDSEFMLEALALAKMGWGLTNPNPMVGAVVVRDGKIIGRGFHRKAGEAHAEINALNDVRRHSIDPQGAEMYVTLEPCSTYGRTPPCTEAIISAGIRRVVIGSLDPNPKHNGDGVKILRDNGIEVVCGVEQSACSELNRCFFHWITTGKPFVMLKMAMTLDGKIATLTGDSKWITCPESRRRVQKLRRISNAIMVGGNTLRNDHPMLTVREPENWERQPLRIIVSRSMDQSEAEEYFEDGNVEVVSLPEREDWHDYLVSLGQRQMTALLIEGGGELAASALQAGVVDFVEFHIAPKLLCGRDSKCVTGGESPLVMADALDLQRLTVERCADDIIISGYL